MVLTVIDRAMQSFGAEGVSQDTELARRWAGLRTLRIADVRILCFTTAYDSDLFFMNKGPDAVHIQQVGQRELKRAPGLVKKAQELQRKEVAMLQKYGLKAHL
jgi:acyl-CoA dehydrogenase